jgi:hypothetical protein
VKQTRGLGRKTYKPASKRLDFFLGLNISGEMREEILREARRSLSRPSDFVRLLLKEALTARRARDERAGLLAMCCVLALTSFAAAPALAEAGAVSCGASAAEAIAAAEKAIVEKNVAADSRALTCLIVAMKTLEAERLDAVRGKDKSHVLSVPRTR